MRVWPRRSLAYRLWLRLSVIALATATLALCAFVWFSLEDNIEQAHKQSHSNFEALLTATARLIASGSPPTAAESGAARALGAISIELIAPQGVVLASDGPFASTAETRKLTAGELEALAGDPRLVREIRIRETGYQGASLNPLSLLKGGHFGEEHIYATDELVPGMPGYVRFIAAYPDLTSEARALVLRSLALTAVIVAGMANGMWILVDSWSPAPCATTATWPCAWPPASTFACRCSTATSWASLARRSTAWPMPLGGRQPSIR